MRELSKRLAERIAHERELREVERAAVEHERELRALWDTHEREMRLSHEEAVEKARQLQFDTLELRLESMNEFRAQLTVQAATLMPIDRFEREHSTLRERYEREHTDLIGRMEAAFRVVNEKVDAQEKVTIRQDTSESLLAASGQSHRWQVGIAVTLIGMSIATLLTLITLITHLAGIY